MHRNTRQLSSGLGERRGKRQKIKAERRGVHCLNQYDSTRRIEEHRRRLPGGAAVDRGSCRQADTAVSFAMPLQIPAEELKVQDARVPKKNIEEVGESFIFF